MKIPENVLVAAWRFSLEMTYDSDMAAGQVMARFLRSCPTDEELAAKARRERIATAALAGLLAYSGPDCQDLKYVGSALNQADILIAKLDEELPHPN